MTNPKITPEHLQRGALVYVRQSSPGQVVEHEESRRRQYGLADTARELGFASVATIDDDLGRSGSGLVERPGFQRLVTSVCTGSVGAVLCIEASRLARNGRDWHQLIDLCALLGTLVIDSEGVYDPRLTNDRLLLGLKGTMSEYELSLLQQRGRAARDSKAQRGELRFGLPPGYCWDDLSRIQRDADARVVEAIKLIFTRFRELRSARQAFLWMLEQDLQLPVVRRGPRGAQIEWGAPLYPNLVSTLRNPCYAGAYAYGRTENRTRIVEGRARKTCGHKKPRERWSVLIRDNHEAYISWEEYERNQTILSENAHMHGRTSRKSGRGGRALLSGLIRCGRCGRVVRVAYRSRGRAHLYKCQGSTTSEKCVTAGGLGVDNVVSEMILAAVAPHALEAAIEAAQRATQVDDDVMKAAERELEEARYEADLAGRRHSAVDPDKRLVAIELEARWEAALGHVQELEEKIARKTAWTKAPPRWNREQLMALAEDLPSAWDAESTDMQAKQRIVQILIHEVVIDLDETSHETIVTIHWCGGQHTETRLQRASRRRSTVEGPPSATEAVRRLGGRWSDRELAVTLNRMGCRNETGGTWKVVHVRAMREELGIEPYQPPVSPTTVTMAQAARRLDVGVGSVRHLISSGVLPARQEMACAPWEIPVAALDTQAVRIRLRAIIERRRRMCASLQRDVGQRLPGM